MKSMCSRKGYEDHTPLHSLEREPPINDSLVPSLDEEAGSPGSHDQLGKTLGKTTESDLATLSKY